MDGEKEYLENLRRYSLISKTLNDDLKCINEQLDDINRGLKAQLKEKDAEHSAELIGQEHRLGSMLDRLERDNEALLLSLTELTDQVTQLIKERDASNARACELREAMLQSIAVADDYADSGISRAIRDAISHDNNVKE